MSRERDNQLREIALKWRKAKPRHFWQAGGLYYTIENVEKAVAEAFQAGENLGREQAIGDCIERVMKGRTIHNFGHVPEIVRALEWVWADLQELQEEANRTRGVAGRSKEQ